MLTIEMFEKLSNPSVFDVVKTVVRELSSVGGRSFFVGGCVRDAILNIPLSDFDIEVFGLSLDDVEMCLSKNFTVEKSGKSFCVVKLKGFPIDVSIPRKEIKSGDKHVDFQVSPLEGGDVRAAARRRDFTVNSIYFDPVKNEVIDEYNGVDDLKHKVLRHVSDSFSEDPLRVLRGMQFAGRFDLECADETAELCGKLTIEKISKERVFAEWRKFLLKSKKPSMGVKFLKDVNWLKFFPEIEQMDSCMQDPERHPEGSVLTHTCLALDAYAKSRLADRSDDEVLSFAVLCHDFGKPYVTTQDSKGIHHYNHAQAGVEPTFKFLTSMGAPRWLIEGVVPLVRSHMMSWQVYNDHTDSSVLKLAAMVKRIDLLLHLNRMDFAGRIGWEKRYDGGKVYDWLHDAAKRLGVLTHEPYPLVGGRDLVNLGLEPSEKFSEILNECYEAQLDCDITDRASALVFLKSRLHL